jgi:uncharacterized protein YneF (UPF0154 family)
MESIVSALIVGILGGFIYALTGLMKSLTTEPFSPKKFIRTLLIGIAAGIMLSLSGHEVTVDAINVAIAAGETVVIEQLIIAIFRAVSKYFSGG